MGEQVAARFKKRIKGREPVKAGLPAIRASEGSGVLMADKHQSEMYLENFTQRNELMEVEILQISRHPRKQTENSIKKEHRKM